MARNVQSQILTVHAVDAQQQHAAEVALADAVVVGKRHRTRSERGEQDARDCARQGAFY